MPPPLFHCNTCFRPLPPGEADGRCPACLIAAAFEEPEADTIGELGGHDLLEEIARGGMGVVYRARQREPEREVALKAILGGWLSAPEVRERFRLEARAMAALEHPAILPVYQFGEQDQVPFFTMKLADGGTLTGRLAAFAGKWREIAALMVTVAEAVQFAHERGVLHRDLKPGNILFDAENRVYVSDFGMAKLLDGDSDLTRSAALLGTPHYMAPEIASHGATATTASDVWSLGVMLYELLAQVRPFASVSMPALLREIGERDPAPLPALVSRDLAVITMKALSKSPATRYPTARDLADDLRRWLRGEPILARPRSSMERCAAWCRRYPAVASLTGLLLVGAVVAASILLKSNRALVEAVQAKEQARQLSDDRLRHSLFSEADALLLGEDPTSREPVLNIVRQLKTMGLPPLEVRNLAVRSLVTLGAHEAGRFETEFYSASCKLDYSPDFHWYATGRSRSGKGFTLYSTHRGEAPQIVDAAGIGITFRFSRDGTWLAAKLSTGHILVRRVGELGKEFFQTTIRMSGGVWMLPLDFHPSDSHWLYSTGDTSVHRHLTSSGTAKDDEIFLNAPGPVQGLSYSPDGSRLALKWEGGVGVVDSVSGNWIWQRPLACTTDWPFWNPSGKGLGIGVSNPVRFLILNADTGEEKVTCYGHQAAISMAAFHPTLPIVATVAWDYQLILWDSQSGLPLTRHSAMVRGVSFSADGTRLSFSPGQSQTSVIDLTLPTVWRAWEGEPIPASIVVNMDLSSDGQWLLTDSVGQIRLWDVANRKSVTTIDLPFTSREEATYWQNGDHLIRGLPAPTKVITKTLTLSPEPKVNGAIPQITNTDPISSAWIYGRTADRQKLILQTPNGGARVMNEDGTVHLEIPTWGQRKVLDLSPDDRWVACLQASSAAMPGYEVRRVKDGVVVHQFAEPWAAQLSFSPDGKSLVIAEAWRTLVYETETWRELTQWPVQMEFEGYGGVSFSPDGKMAAIRVREGTIDLRETSHWTQLALLRAPGTNGQNSGLYRMIWTADNQRLLVLQQGSRVSEWDLQRLRQELGTLGLDW